MEIIYADSLFALNAAVDYLVLLGAGKLCALPLRRGRMVCGAAWGGIYAVAAAVWPGIFALLTVKLLAGALMTFIAFGAQRRTLRAAAAVYAVSAAFGGAVYAAAHLAGTSVVPGRWVPVSARTLLLSFALCYAAVSLIFRRVGRRAERRVCEVTLRHGGGCVRFSALIDSGNELTDPLSGDPVLIAEAAALAPLFPDGLPPADADAFAALSFFADRGLHCRLLPCACVTAPRALLLCFRPDEIKVNGIRRRMLVGISPNVLSSDGDYAAIIAQ